MLSQSPWVSGPSGRFTVDLRVGTTSPTAELGIYVYPRLAARSDFQATLRGYMQANSFYRQVLPVSSLPAAAGTVELVLPVDATSTAGRSAAGPSAGPPGALSGVTLGGQDGVYPVQIGVISPSTGAFVGNAITTYLVWSPAPTDFPKLRVSWVVPVHADPALTAAGLPTRLPDRETSVLAGEIDALAGHGGAPVSLQVDPQAVAALQSGGPAGRTAVTTLSSLAAGGDEVLPAPYVNVDYGAMAAAGLSREVDAQLLAGARTLRSLIGAVTPPGTWVVNGPLDATTGAGLVRDHRISRLVVPDDDLSALPAADLYNTFAQPSVLASPAGRAGGLASPAGRTEVFGADAALQLHLSDTGDQVLQANQFLAELAMIDTEQPGDRRGVAVLAPPGWTPSRQFLDAALSGLQGNPLLAPVTGDQLFARVPVAGGSEQPSIRSLVAAPPPGDAVADAGAIRAGRRQLDAFVATFPTATAPADGFALRLLVAQSADLSGRRRDLVLSALSSALTRSLDGVRVAPGGSITLTARDGNVPVTVESSAGGPAHVALQLTSQKLTFRSFTPAGGNCRSPNATSVVCDLVLTHPATTLKVPVVTRTSGVFSLELAVKSADGAFVLGQARYPVRSTAVSAVAVVLMIGAVFLLGLWWVRDRRHGRRARQLVDRRLSGDRDREPRNRKRGDRAPESRAPESRAPGDAVTDDPVVAEFFASPAPNYPDPEARRRGSSGEQVPTDPDGWRLGRAR